MLKQRVEPSLFSRPPNPPAASLTFCRLASAWLPAADGDNDRGGAVVQHKLAGFTAAPVRRKRGSARFSDHAAFQRP